MGQVCVPLELLVLHKVRRVPGVIRLLKGFDVPDAFIIVTELMEPSENLHDLIVRNGCLDERQAGKKSRNT